MALWVVTASNLLDIHVPTFRAFPKPQTKLAPSVYNESGQAK